MRIRVLANAFLSIVSLLVAIPNSSLATETWSGDGSIQNPCFYLFVDRNGDGFWHRRGQNEVLIGGALVQSSIDEGGAITGFNLTKTKGSKQKIVTTYIHKLQNTEIYVRSIPEKLRVQAVAGGDDLTEWRKAEIIAIRNLNDDWLAGDVTAVAEQDSFAAAIGAPVPRIGTHGFYFCFANGVWDFELLRYDERIYTSGDFGENDSLDLLGVHGDPWWSSIENIRFATSALDFVELIFSFPYPYLDFEFISMDQDYIFANIPMV